MSSKEGMPENCRTL